MKALLREVTDALGPWLYTGAVPAGGLQCLTVNDHIGNGGKILAVFDGLSAALKGQFAGVYIYADLGGTGDLVVYDSYADSNDLATMRTDQLTKLDAPENHTGNLFLFSWTLTQSTTQAVLCPTGAAPSILDLAQQADGALWSDLIAAYRQGKITPALMANLICTDNVQGTQTDFAIWLNARLSSPAA